MILLEQKTRRIEMLVGRTKPPAAKQKQRRYEEDILPKVLICGMADNNMPKIIVCDNKVKGPKRDRRSSVPEPPKMCPPCVLPLADMVSIIFCLYFFVIFQQYFKFTVCHAAVCQTSQRKLFYAGTFSSRKRRFRRKKVTIFKYSPVKNENKTNIRKSTNFNI